MIRQQPGTQRRHHGDLSRATQRDAALAKLRGACTSRARRRLAKRLACELACMHGIRPTETRLACWLTDTQCTDNGEALVLWVLHELPPASQREPEADLLQGLSTRLCRRLADLAELQPW